MNNSPGIRGLWGERVVDGDDGDAEVPGPLGEVVGVRLGRLRDEPAAVEVEEHGVGDGAHLAFAASEFARMETRKNKELILVRVLDNSRLPSMNVVINVVVRACYDQFPTGSCQ